MALTKLNKKVKERWIKKIAAYIKRGIIYMTAPASVDTKRTKVVDFPREVIYNGGVVRSH